VTHSSSAVSRCTGDARRDVRMMDLLYLLSTDGHTILGDAPHWARPVLPRVAAL